MALPEPPAQPALEDNLDGGVDLATRDSSDPSHTATPSFSWAGAPHGSGLRGHFDP